MVENPPRAKVRKFHLLVLVFVVICVCLSLLAIPPIGRLFHPIKLRLLGRYTIDQRIDQYGDDVHRRLLPAFEKAGVPYPPMQLTLVGLKQERMLEIYAADLEGVARHVLSYPILGASGESGPKLKEGDRQVPEGLYRVEGLNPNSRYHLSIKADYPNAFDREMAEIDGRTKLGGDIFIHGGAASVGCLAIGDEAIEELFVLLAETGIEHVDIVLAPQDLRVHELSDPLEPGDWRHGLYVRIIDALQRLPKGE